MAWNFGYSMVHLFPPLCRLDSHQMDYIDFFRMDFGAEVEGEHPCQALFREVKQVFFEPGVLLQTSSR